MKRSALNLAFQYFKFLFRSKGLKSVHSPFLFDLLKRVRALKAPPFFEEIEVIRKKNLNDTTQIPLIDYGAGSRRNPRIKTIRNIAKNSMKPKKQAQLIYKLCHCFYPSNIIELGTSLGITTLYLSRSSNHCTVYTFEGDPNIIRKARLNADEFGAHNIEFMEGNMNETLPKFMTNSPSIDVAFIDGNHQLAPTLSYFDQLRSMSHSETLFILDDIHWSAEMEDAWHIIQKKEFVTLTVDCFHFGLVFIKRELSKQDITIRL